MTPNTKLIMFMRAKDERLKEYGYYQIYKDTPYFTDSDVMEILSWSSKDALFLWHGLVKALTVDKADGLNGCTCPFCYQSEYIKLMCYSNFDFSVDKCLYCNYGTRHGRCNNQGSTYHVLKFWELGIFNSFSEIFTNEFYLRVFNDIEKQEEEEQKDVFRR